MFDTLFLKTGVLNLWTSFMDKFSIPTNLEKYLIFLPVFVIGFLVTFVITPIIGNIAKKYDAVYVPNIKRKGKRFDNEKKAIHKGIIPALGGLGIMIPLLLSILLCFELNSTTLPFVIGLGILTIGGVLDDLFNIPAKTQLLLQILAASVIAVSALDLDAFSIFSTEIPMNMLQYQGNIGAFAISLIFPGDLILLVWLIFCINSFKWVGGSPGLIEGNAFIITILIFIISVRHMVLLTSATSALLIGSLLAFLIFAYPPPLIMSGASGKSTYGLMICILGLVSGAKFATTLILLLLPTLDAIYVIVKRYLEYKPKNPLDLIKISGTDHFHHRLLKLNLTPQNVFWVEIGITLLVGSFAIFSTGALRFFLLIWGSIFIIAITLFLTMKNSTKEDSKSKEKESSESKYSY